MARPGTTPQERAVREERLRSLARDLLVHPHITQVELAKRYGVSQPQISKDIALINQRYRTEAKKDTAARVGKQLAAYDAIKDAHLPLAIEGKTRSAEVVMQALAGESKLLGMDRPVKQHIEMEMTRYQITGVSDDDLAGVIVPGGDK